MAEAKLFNFTTQKANIVCPSCGLVWKDGKPYDHADSIEDWVAYGYDPVACPDCMAKGKTVGFSGEFDFAEGV